MKRDGEAPLDPAPDRENEVGSDIGEVSRRMDELGLAIDALLARGAGDEACDDEDLLERHPGLAELLGPLLDGEFEEDELGTEASASEREEGLETRYIAGYRIEREVGRGGMGVVYEAIEESLGRRVALKVLSKRFGDSPAAIQRFRREAGAVAGLRHEAIVPIYSIGYTEGVHHFAMEFVEGQSLAAKIAHAQASSSRAMPTRQAVELVAQIADALDYVHASGVVHRDVKPHNIMLADDGRVLLVDFGLAHVRKRGDAAGLAGTPYYMSPEQLRGEAGLDGRCDVFALGVVLFELLVGARPFDGESATEVLRAVLREEPSFALLREAKLPRDLSLICRRALEKDREDRYANAAAFAADLRRFLRHETVHAVPPSYATRVSKFVRRRRAWVAAGMISTAIVAGLTIAVLADAEERERSSKASRVRERSAVLEVLRLSTGTDVRSMALASSDAKKHFERVKLLCEEALQNADGEVSWQFRERFATHLMRAGRFYLDIGARDEALASYRAALAAYSLLRERHGEGIIAANDLVAASYIAEITGDASAMDEPIARVRSRLSDRSAERSAALRSTLAVALSVRARWHRKRQEIDRARRDIRAAIALWKRGGRDLQDSQMHAGAYSWILLTQSRLLRREGKLEEADRAVEEGLAHNERLLQRSPTKFPLRMAQASLLAAKAENARLRPSNSASARAEEAYREAIVVRRAMARDYPEYHLDVLELARLEMALGDCLLRRRRLQAAKEAWKAAYARLERVEQPQSQLYLAILDGQLGSLYCRARKPPLAKIASHYRSGERRFAAVLATEPTIDRQLSYIDFLRGKARYLELSEGLAAARACLDAVGVRIQKLVELAPEHPSVVRKRKVHASMYSALLIRAREYDEARKFALSFAASMPSDAIVQGQAAQDLCRVLGALAKDAKIDEADRDAKLDAFGRDAIALLETAVKRGAPKPEVILSARLFRVLRQHEDWPHLVSCIRARCGSGD